MAHSWSPFIHGLFARETGESMSYRLYDFTAEEFAQRVREFFRQGGRGLNVTLPHKIAALQLAQDLTARAAHAAAVNTLALCNDGTLLGDNTDGTGLMRDLCDNLGIVVTQRRVLIIGAGGAARGVLAPLLTLQPSETVIANRTPERARSLAAAFAKLGVVSAVGLEHIPGGAFDLLINATAASLSGEIPAVPATVLGPQTVCYDMAYGKGDTAFVRWALEHGCTRAVQGWGMLVEQAAESFRIWRGMRPSTAPVLAALRQHQRNVTSSSAMVG
ncbi:MAG: shikimate dehydrogenase [Gammaproteobacteria bacterium]|nr:MAG: shikimate dehydrogenase [Gammaproteobacteria bacterium]